MVYQLNIQTIPLTRRSHLIVGFPVADTAAWVWSITAAVRRPRIRTACLPGSVTSSLTLTTCPGWPGCRTQAPGGKVLCAGESEIVIGTHENAAAGLCFMPVKNRMHLDLTSSAQGTGPSWPTPGETSSA
jgi:hypothetical protein